MTIAIDILLPITCSQALIAQSVRRRIFYLEVRRPYPVGTRMFAFLLSFLFFLYIQMFFYTIMKLFMTLLENVNKSQTSAGRLSSNNDFLSLNTACVWPTLTTSHQNCKKKLKTFKK
jgi:cyanate permease